MWNILKYKLSPLGIFLLVIILLKFSVEFLSIIQTGTCRLDHYDEDVIIQVRSKGTPGWRDL